MQMMRMLDNEEIIELQSKLAELKQEKRNWETAHGDICA